jgi:eukaryotic-like serine/threonine-protein kinase
MPATVGTVDERALARVGTTIAEKYRLEQLLGVGGMAAVYDATHRNGNRVALKMLHPELSIDREVRTRFLREGYVANKVDHHGVVRVLDDHEGDDGVFLVMDLLEGESLDARVERAGGWLPIEEVCAITEQLLEVLEAAHAASIVHRDIKPDNLFLTTDGAVRVLDFGIARMSEPNGAHHTRTGRTMGTPAYMPPEQARGRRSDVDGKTDLWAAGATMFTLLSGQYVHQGAETTEELVILSATRHVRPLAEAAPHVPQPIAAVVDRALAYATSERWPSATGMREALEQAFFSVYGRSLRGAKLAFADERAASKERSAPARGDATRSAAWVPARNDEPATRPPTPPPSAPRAATNAGLTRSQGATTSSTSRPATILATAGVSLILVLAVAIVVGRTEWGGARPPSSASVIAPTASAPLPPPLPEQPSASAVASVSASAPAPLPPAPTTHAQRTGGPAGARPAVVAAASSAASDCPLESYVEIVKGEPVTRYRRVCR